MAESAVVNASPLILLARAGRVELLQVAARVVIPAARPVVEQLRSCGMYLSDQVLDEALAKIGE